MMGLMMDRPMLLSHILDVAVRNFCDQEIVTRTVEGPIHRYTYTDAEKRIKKLANALVKLGVREGDRIGVIGWNTYRQLELYYALAGIGAICHTVNPRLGPENAGYVMGHAEDRFVFFDTTFTPLVDALAPQLPSVERWFALTDADHLPEPKAFRVEAYEDLLAGESEDFEWREFDENTACALCYTSGTTGRPKGVLYSHRALFLQTLATGLSSGYGFTSHDVVLPVVPMFHVNAWNTPYTALMIGCKYVLPGPRLDGEGLYDLIESEGVTYSLGVPTVWLNLLNYVDSTGKTFSTMEWSLVGGAALSAPLIEGYARHGVRMRQGWGMTEMSPLGTVNAPHPKTDAMDDKTKLKEMLKAGRAMPLVEMRIVSDEGEVLPNDGETTGHLEVRGPWVIKQYFKHDAPILSADGWFDTGDISAIDTGGQLIITDRSKDVIKSGGEWISSIDVENAAMTHPGVLHAAVIGVPHPKWDERPLLVVVCRAGEDPAPEDIRAHCCERLAKIAWPDAVEFVDELPLGATGKVLKTKLRERFKGYTLGA